MFGGGNPVGGGNPSGTGGTLNYIGNFVYANSGTFEASTTEQTLFNFTTGAEIVKCKINCYGQVQFDNTGAGGISTWQLSLNSEVTALLRIDTSALDMGGPTFINLVIPPFTKVTLKMLSAEDNANELLTAMLTGSVH
jgi:hypothetical protein|tara:strand:+ start:40 stop:453 length:414 start_codon:yes stop_codon:yes gene_type:complete